MTGCDLIRGDRNRRRTFSHDRHVEWRGSQRVNLLDHHALEAPAGALYRVAVWGLNSA